MPSFHRQLILLIPDLRSGSLAFILNYPGRQFNTRASDRPGLLRDFYGRNLYMTFENSCMISTTVSLGIGHPLLSHSRMKLRMPAL